MKVKTEKEIARLLTQMHKEKFQHKKKVK